MTQRWFLLFSALVFPLTLGGCPSNPAPTDTGPVDAGPVDAPRDAPPRADSPMPADALTNERAAQASFIPAFCRCAAPRVDPPITEAECIAQNQPDEPFAACERAGYEATEGGLDGFFNCIAAGIAAREACYEAATTCDMAETDACDADQDTANAACREMITTAALDAYNAANDACVESTIIGSSAGSCLAAGAAVSDLGDEVFSGTTVLGGDHTDPTPSCVNFRLGDAQGAADRAHRWRAPMAGVYRFDTLGTTFDSVLYIRQACETTQFGCNDDAEEGEPTSAVEVLLAADQEVAVIVDGFGPEQRGDYQVNITFVGAGDAGPPDLDAGMPDAGSDAGMSDAGPLPDVGPPEVEVLSMAACSSLTPVLTIDATLGAYNPASSTATVGDVVRFIPGSAFHNMVSVDVSGPTPVPDGTFMTPLGMEVCLRFNVAARYDFACEFHGFLGDITISP